MYQLVDLEWEWLTYRLHRPGCHLVLWLAMCVMRRAVWR